MRQLSPAGRTLGVTLVEMVVVMAFLAIVSTLASPFLTDYIANSRLRESGNALMAEALFAQSEAIKRNGPVRLAVTATGTQVVDLTGPAPAVIRDRQFPDRIIVETLNIDFGSDGMTRPRGTDATVDVSGNGITCSADYRCPRLQVDAGGALRLCGNKLECGS
jgi:type IV fimbrial biogenesis protein FimT